jgi:hypothetical protein
LEGFRHPLMWSYSPQHWDMLVGSLPTLQSIFLICKTLLTQSCKHQLQIIQGVAPTNAQGIQGVVNLEGEAHVADTCGLLQLASPTNDSTPTVNNNGSIPRLNAELAIEPNTSDVILTVEYTMRQADPSQSSKENQVDSSKDSVET